MTRKDYILIASALAKGKERALSLAPKAQAEAMEQWRVDLSYLIDILIVDNYRFDKERFLCNVNRLGE